MTNQLESDNKYFNHFLGKFINRLLSAIISFLIAVFLSFTLRSIFNLGVVSTLVILILTGIILSPIFSKIKFNLGYVIEEEYFKFLDKYTKKWINKK